MNAENSFSWRNIVTLAMFCVVAALGGGVVMRNILHDYGAWTAVGYGASVGIFIAAFSVILMQFFSSLKEQQ